MIEKIREEYFKLHGEYCYLFKEIQDMLKYTNSYNDKVIDLAKFAINNKLCIDLSKTKIPFSAKLGEQYVIPKSSLDRLMDILGVIATAEGLEMIAVRTNIHEKIIKSEK